MDSYSHHYDAILMPKPKAVRKPRTPITQEIVESASRRVAGSNLPNPDWKVLYKRKAAKNTNQSVQDVKGSEDVKNGDIVSFNNHITDKVKLRILSQSKKELSMQGWSNQDIRAQRVLLKNKIQTRKDRLKQKKIDEPHKDPTGYRSVLIKLAPIVQTIYREYKESEYGRQYKSLGKLFQRLSAEAGKRISSWARQQKHADESEFEGQTNLPIGVNGKPDYTHLSVSKIKEIFNPSIEEVHLLAQQVISSSTSTQQ